MSTETPGRPWTRPPEPGRDLDLPSWLATLYTPILPYLKKVRVRHEGPRGHAPKDILLPRGYAAEVVATDLNAPVHCCFDDRGGCYVVESGHKVQEPPRIVRVDTANGRQETYFTWPADRWKQTGAVTGALWHAGSLIVSNTDAVSRIHPDGRIEDLVTDLPGRGDHQTNYPLLGPDGKVYFGVGSATNAGVVGADNAAYEWLPKFPRDCDVPARDVTLSGRNYEFPNVLASVTERVRTGAYVPFGTETTPGQVVKGSTKCNGSVVRCDPDGLNLEVVAWGLRNPYGIAFAPDGRLFATEHGMDNRGGRYVVNDLDDFYEIENGRWYGWPDFASGIRLDDPSWGDGGQGREPVLAAFPEENPPKPLLSFDPHVGANGVSFSPGGSFGFQGDAFVALFGDLAPVTSPRLASPRGNKVVRVDLRGRRIVDFAINKIQGPASKLPHDGFERPSHCAFGPDGHLYVVDFGEINIAPERGGVRMQLGTGTLWRIRRTGEPAGQEPPRPMQVPFYVLQALGQIGALLGLVGGVSWLVGRLLRRRRQRWIDRFS